MTDHWDDYAMLRTALLEHPMTVPPALRSSLRSYGSVQIEDLVEAEAVTVYLSPPTLASDNGDLPMLSVKDVRLGRPPSRYGSADTPGAVTVRSGDIAVVVGVGAAISVCTDGGILLGPGIHLVRCNPDTLDPHFLACVLRGAIDTDDGSPVDLYGIEVPRVPLAEQRRYGVAYARLCELEASWRRRRANIEQLVRTGIRGLATGALQPDPGE
ncbi:hypothetical protein [Nocardia cyriacigeorgica]|nr:hypothetical protein [Nocardia cyriacigeorgica]